MGFGITVKGLDSAGGVQLGGGQSSWSVEGQPIVLLGDPVAGHGQAPHNGPTMIEASGWMTLNGVPVVRAGNKASCNHPSTGRGWFTLPS
jgi:uncharacterized Zn-binding protein involved in type VI secretion